MKYAVCTLNELEPGKPYVTKVNGVEIGLFLQEKRVYAVRNVCPHKLAPVCKGTIGGTMLPTEPCEYRYGLNGQVLKCPWHGWEFDLTNGEALFNISNRKVKTYPITVEDGQIYIEM